MRRIFLITGESDYLDLMSYASSTGLKWQSGVDPMDFRPLGKNKYFIVIEDGFLSFYRNVVLGIQALPIPTREYL